MKRFIPVCVALAAALGLSAEVTDIIKMRNGNMYYGFIWMQLPNGEIGVAADSTVEYLPQAEIARIEYLPGQEARKRNLANIYLAGRETMADTAVYVTEEAVDTVVWGETATPPQAAALHGVEILEEGSTIKFRDTNPKEVKLLMSDVVEIERPRLDPTQLNGLYDEVETNSGVTYTGRIISTEPGKSIRLADDNGRVYRIPMKNITVQRRVAIDPAETLFNQSPLIDNVYTKSEGVKLNVLLVEQNYANGTFDILDENNMLKRYKMSQFGKIRRTVNRDYTPRYRFDFEEGSYYINREKVVVDRCRKSGSRVKASIPFDTAPRVHADKGTITLECSDDMDNLRMILVPVKRTVLSTPRADGTTDAEISISAKQLVDEAIPATVHSIDQGNILRRQYEVHRGYYAFVDSRNGYIILFHVV